MIDYLEQSDMAGVFQYQLFKSREVTGDFKVTLFKDADLEGDGEVFFSKKETGTFPEADFDGFKKLCQKALDNMDAIAAFGDIM